MTETTELLDLQCKLCHKIFKAKRYLKSHEKLLHPDFFDKRIGSSVRCQEDDCNESFQCISRLRDHLGKHHQMKMECELLSFSEKQECLLWKQSVEKENSCTFSNATGVKRSHNGYKKTYFYCNRSGKSVTKHLNEMKRRRRTQGTSKIDHHCTAAIIMGENNEGKIQVEYYKTHYRHNKDLEHLRITEIDKGIIARKLSLGVSPESIVNDIRKSIDGNFKRLHLITKKDVNNIARMFGVYNDVQKDIVNSISSIDIWVKEMKRGDNDDIVILYKAQNEDSDIFNREDFLLGIMSDSQADMLVEYGNSSVVCLDSIRGTNPYDFILISILVMDDHGTEFPVAFLVSNRDDYTAIETFLNAVHENAGAVHPHYLMSDDRDQYFSAWNSVYGDNPKKLLCSWHVKSAWESNMSTIKDLNTRTKTYNMLQALMQENNVSKFNLMLDRAIKELNSNPDTVGFADYFCNNYCDRVTTWALCYRIGLGILKEYFEDIHTILKDLYLTDKSFIRLDKTVCALAKYMQDKGLQRKPQICKLSSLITFASPCQIVLNTSSETKMLATMSTNSSLQCVSEKGSLKLKGKTEIIDANVNVIDNSNFHSISLPLDPSNEILVPFDFVNEITIPSQNNFENSIQLHTVDEVSIPLDNDISIINPLEYVDELSIPMDSANKVTMPIEIPLENSNLLDTDGTSLNSLDIVDQIPLDNHYGNSILVDVEDSNSILSVLSVVNPNSIFTGIENVSLSPLETSKESQPLEMNVEMPIQSSDDEGHDILFDILRDKCKTSLEVVGDALLDINVDSSIPLKIVDEISSPLYFVDEITIQSHNNYECSIILEVDGKSLDSVDSGEKMSIPLDTAHENLMHLENQFHNSILEDATDISLTPLGIDEDNLKLLEIDDKYSIPMDINEGSSNILDDNEEYQILSTSDDDYVSPLYDVEKYPILLGNDVEYANQLGGEQSDDDIHEQHISCPQIKCSDRKVEDIVRIMQLSLNTLRSKHLPTKLCDAIYPHVSAIKDIIDNL